MTQALSPCAFSRSVIFPLLSSSSHSDSDSSAHSVSFSISRGSPAVFPYVAQVTPRSVTNVSAFFLLPFSAKPFLIATQAVRLTLLRISTFSFALIVSVFTPSFSPSSIASLMASSIAARPIVLNLFFSLFYPLMQNYIKRWGKRT